MPFLLAEEMKWLTSILESESTIELPGRDNLTYKTRRRKTQYHPSVSPYLSMGCLLFGLVGFEDNQL